MAVSFEDKNRPASKAALRAVEKKLGRDLPDAYRKFLTIRNGGVPESNEFEVPSASTSSGVDAFFDVDEVMETAEDMAGRLPRKVIPIADAEGGNLVCLSLRDADYGAIYFWDHEMEAEDNTDSSLFLLAKDFEGFCELLLPFDPEDVELKEGQVLEVWINPLSKLK